MRREMAAPKRFGDDAGQLVKDARGGCQGAGAAPGEPATGVGRASTPVANDSRARVLMTASATVLKAMTFKLGQSKRTPAPMASEIRLTTVTPAPTTWANDMDPARRKNRPTRSG